MTEAVSVAQVRGLTAALHPRCVSHRASGIRELPMQNPCTPPPKCVSFAMDSAVRMAAITFPASWPLLTNGTI